MINIIDEIYEEDRGDPSNEPVGFIPVMRVIEKLDSFFASNDLEGAKRLLSNWENEARMLGDRRGLLSVLNEKIGLCRRTADKEKGLCAVEEALSMLASEDFPDGAAEATILLNCATTMKAFGKADEAMPIYEKAEDIYKKSLRADDFRFAGLYNNMATACTELKQYERAEKLYLSALSLLEALGIKSEAAVTYINMAHLYYDMDPFDGRISECAEKAWDLLNSKDITHDANYAFICSKCAPSFGFLGYFTYDKELSKRSDAIYGA